MEYKENTHELILNVMLYISWKDERKICNSISVEGFGHIARIKNVTLSTGIEREILNSQIRGAQFSNGEIIEVLGATDGNPFKEYYIVINKRFHPFAYTNNMDETLEGETQEDLSMGFYSAMTLEDIEEEAAAYAEEFFDSERPNPYRVCSDCGNEFKWDSECPACLSINVGEMTPDDHDAE